MASASYVETQSRPAAFWGLLAAGGLFLLAAFAAFLHFEHSGHVVTGMDNQIVWGMPHVFAVFLIVAASGVLNVASIGSVFGKPIYKARAPLSGLLALAMMAGGLAVLAADLGRPDRLIVAMTHFNFKSIFALEHDVLFGLLRHRRRLPGDDDGPQPERLLEDRRLPRLLLAPGADHRHRLDLRLPDRPHRLRLGPDGADVHHLLLRLRPRGLPHRAGLDVRLERPARSTRASSPA
ncbi:hypothetical protein MASR1M97_09410 [Candidatus Desulfobacillus denitrificans]